MIGWSSSGSGRRCPGRTLEGQAAVLLPAAQFRVIFLNTGQAVGNTHTQETWWVPGYGHLSPPQMWAWSPTELVPEWPLPLGRRRSLRQLHPWGSRCSVPPLGGEEVARGTMGRLPPPGCHQPGQVGSPPTHTPPPLPQAHSGVTAAPPGGAGDRSPAHSSSLGNEGCVLWASPWCVPSHLLGL